MSSPSTKLADTISILKRLGLFDLLVRNPTLHKEREGWGDRLEEDRQKPEIVHTQEQSRPIAGQRPQVSDRVRLRDESKLQGKPQPLTRTQRERVGRKDRQTGRQIVQPTKSPIENEKLAAQNAPQLESRLSAVAARVPGAKFERLRPQKNLARVNEKIKEGKPAATISDYLAAQISAASPEAKDRLVRELKKDFPVINVEDRFLKGRKDKAGYPSANVQVKLPNAATSEVQIVPTEVQKITDQTHHLYKEGRNAHDAGDREAAQNAFAQANQMNRQAIRHFLQRNHENLPKPASASGADPKQDHPSTSKPVKGQEVVLFGRGKATVRYVSPTMNVIRVRTAHGKNLTVGVADIKQQ